MDKNNLVFVLYLNLLLLFVLGTIYLSGIINLQYKMDSSCFEYGYARYDAIQRDCYYDDWNYSFVRENGKITDLKINNFKHYSEMDKG